MAYGAVLALVLMMLLVFTDVVARYFFNAPISGAVEIIYCLMALMVFLGLGLVTYERRHIRVDVVTNLLSTRLKAFADVLAHGFGAVAVVLLAWRVTVDALARTQEREASQVFELPIWAVAIVGAIGSIVFVLAFATSFLAAWRALTASKPATQTDNES
jgi:TRAP-type C4-dicarboxylate transport system permease small subunit